MSISTTLTGYPFRVFVRSVLNRIALSNNDEIYFESSLPLDFLTSKVTISEKFDAVAPYGFECINGLVVFEFKAFTQKVQPDMLTKTLKRLCKSISRLTAVDATLIFITNSDLASSCDYNSIKSSTLLSSGTIDIQIWDKSKIDKWLYIYPLDFYNAQSFDELSTLGKFDAKITNNDFLEKSQSNIAAIKNVINKEDNFALVLGAGVSVDPGAMSWDDLLKSFANDLKTKGIISDESKLNGKIGGSSIITAQLCRELYPNDTDYYWAIHKGLYDKRKEINQDFALYHIMRIAHVCAEKTHFRILTYNYDNYLESYLDSIKEPFNSLYDSHCDINNKLSIYHVHGFLPKVEYKTHIQPRYRQSIFLTEEKYNELYNQPYSWQISSQLAFFRENICLFVGCSLSDPNIRRLLEMTCKENRTYYAILTKDDMLINDLVIASRHFTRIGIEVIWANDYQDISKKLQQLYYCDTI